MWCGYFHPPQFPPLTVIDVVVYYFFLKIKIFYMYRGISEVLRDPFAITTIALLQELGIRISKSGVRKIFYQRFKDKHLLLLNELQAVLKEVGIETFIALVDYDKLKTFDTPFWLELANDDREQSFELITKVDNNLLYKYDLNAQRTVCRDESLSFQDKKCLVLLLESYCLDYVENAFESNVLIEKQSEAAFSKKIFLYPDLLTPNECFDIINYCESNYLFEKSLVSKIDIHGNLWTGTSSVRTSYSADLKNYPLLNYIVKKIAKTLNVPFCHISPVHCVRYSTKEQFKIHHDASDGDVRMRSIFIYLNEGMSGGELYFPEINRKYVAKTGTCISFPNLDEKLQRIPQSLHASLAVTDGVKYVLTTFENLI